MKIMSIGETYVTAANTDNITI